MPKLWQLSLQKGEMSTDGLSGFILKLLDSSKKSAVIKDSTLLEIKSDLDIKLPKKNN